VSDEEWGRGDRIGMMNEDEDGIVYVIRFQTRHICEGKHRGYGIL
jgi:hypothetical protein